MSITDLILIAVALAMDCFTISIVCGVIMQKKEWRNIITLSSLFGLFQAAMPLIGWAATNHFATYIQDYDHWIAFALLAFLGGRMIRDAFQTEENKSFNPRQLKTQLILAIATSIDALAIGISFALTGYNSLISLIQPLAYIGAASFLFGIIGHLLGIQFGNKVRQRLKPELLGGIILILIGIKILLTHL